MTSRKPRNRRKTQKQRVSRLPQGAKAWSLFALKWGSVAGCACAAAGAVVLASLFWMYGSDADLPKVAELGEYDPIEVSKVRAADGTVIGEVYEERRTFVEFDQVPPLVVKAFLSAEDANFYKHKGIDYFGMLRALLINLKAGKTRQGASTITQQVVKTFLLTPERTFKRKFQEIILARRIEQELSKDEILSLYLNQIYFGHGRYGVQEAARFYFGKDVQDVNAGEAAMLAGLPQAPENISPKKAKNAERAKFRQMYVLSQMVHHGYIERSEAQKWADEPIRVVRTIHPYRDIAPEWVTLAKQALRDRYGEKGVGRSGAAVMTTVDVELQTMARAALQGGLRAYDERKGYGHALKRIKKDKIELELAKLSRRLPKKGPIPGEIYRAVVIEVGDDTMDVDLGKVAATVSLTQTLASDRYNHDGKKAQELFGPGDVVRVKVRSFERDSGRAEVSLAEGPEGAVVVIETETRDVKALVGGYNLDVGDFNRALKAARQPGSTFKPFVYAAAIDSGDFTAASLVNDAPEVYDLWKPENIKKGEFAGPVRIRHALAKSINTVAIRVLSDLGPERVAELARALGIESKLPEELSLALGSGEVTPLELANAFTSIAAGGVYAPARLIAEIGDEPRPMPAAKRVLSAATAYITLNMMESVVREGSGIRASKLGITIAGKTGTSNKERDAWFIGITPAYVFCVWVGYDGPRSLGRHEGGSRTALPVFVDLVSKMRLRDRRFERPDGVSDRRIDKETGLLAAENAPPETTYTEVFLQGTEPRELAPLPDQIRADQFVVDQYEELYDGYEDDDDESGGSAEPAQP